MRCVRSQHEAGRHRDRHGREWGEEWGVSTEEAARITELEAFKTAAVGQAAADAQRILQLEQLAAGILASYHQASDGYRGRVGQVQIARWRKTLAGDQ